MDLEWIEISDGSFAQWETDFDHSDLDQHFTTIEKIGGLVTDIQKEIKVTYDHYLDQT